MEGNKNKLQLPANLGVAPDFPFNKNNTFLFVILLFFLFDISTISSVTKKLALYICWNAVLLCNTTL